MANPAVALSVRERLMQSVVDRVTVAVAPRPVLRQPLAPIPRDRSPALVVQLDVDEPTAIANDRMERLLVLRLVAVARADAAFADMDALLVRAHAALFADMNLGGLALGLRALDVSCEAEDADAGAYATAARYELRYRTHTADLTAVG